MHRAIDFPDHDYVSEADMNPKLATNTSALSSLLQRTWLDEKRYLYIRYNRMFAMVLIDVVAWDLSDVYAAGESFRPLDQHLVNEMSDCRVALINCLLIIRRDLALI